MKKRIAATALILAVAFSAAAGGAKDGAMAKDGDAMMAKDDAMTKEGDAMMAKDDRAKGFYDLSGLGEGVSYFEGEEAALKAAGMDKRTPVYFFAASWCPTCKATYEDIRKNAAAIPSDLRIIFVNYDTEKELKAKYGVTYQHTFVVPDGMGKAVRTWSGSAGVADIAAKAKGL